MRPSASTIEGWLDVYTEVGQVYIQPTAFYVRPITRGEYKRAQSRAGDNAALFTEELCQIGCIWPLDYNFSDPKQLASIPTRVADEVIKVSGLTPEACQQKFFYWREQMLQNEERWDLLIMLVFPYVNYDILDDMTSDQYFHYLAAAEFRLRTQIKTTVNEDVFDPEDFVDLLLCDTEALKKRMEDYNNAQRGPAPQQPTGPRVVMTKTVNGQPVPNDSTEIAPPIRELPPPPSPERQMRLEQLQSDTTRKGPYGRGR